MTIGSGTIIRELVIMTKADKIVIGDHCRVDDFVKLEGGNSLVIGNYVHVASFAHLNIGGGMLRVGNYANFSSGAKIITGGNRPTGRSMSVVAPEELQVIESDVVTIEDFASVLTNAVVLPGLRIGRYARIAAGSVVTKSVPDYEIWAGVPARKIGEIAQ